MNKTVTLLFCSLCLLTSCQNQSAPVQPAADEADFHTQALTQPYLTRKVKRWLSTHQGERLLRELQYARIKHPTMMQQVVSQDPAPLAFFNQLKNQSEVSTYSSSNSTFNTFMESLDPYPIRSSCQAYYQRNHTGDRISGIKTIDPDGSGPLSSYSVYCDQEHDGGGWTMVVAQFEADPVLNWNEGIQNDYAPDLSSSKSFALNTERIPTHTQTAFGQGLNATFVDYVPYVYTTGNLPVSPLLTSPKTNQQYYIHRSTELHYYMHDVGENPDTASSFGWNNALSFDRTGGVQHTWAFTPQYGTVPTRGTSMLGNRQATFESYAWTVWVR